MAAKGQKFPKVKDATADDTYEETPETRAPSDDDDNPVPDSPQRLDLGGSSAPSQASSQPADTTDADISKLKSDLEASNKEADIRTGLRQATAYASLGRHDPNKIYDTDIQAARNAPLEMYKTRQEAKKQQAQSLLDAAHARYFNAEATEIPIKSKREQRKEDADIANKIAERDEAIRAHDLERASALDREAGEMERARMREKGEQDRYSPYETTTRVNPITQEMETVRTNRHTGEVQVIGGSGPAPHAVVEQAQAHHQGLDKQLNDLDATQDQLAGAEEAVRQNKSSFDTPGATLAEGIAKEVPILGPYLANRLGPALRGDAGQNARQLALSAASQRIHEIAGTRGFSQTERAMMAQLVPNENDSAERVIQKLQQAEELAKQAADRIRSKLPANNTPAAAAPTKNVGGKQMYLDPATGKVMVRGG